MKPIQRNENATEYEVFPEMEVKSGNDSITVLLKHDYYSSDNENGRHLLETILSELKNSDRTIGMLIITDSATKLLDKDNDLSSALHDLIIYKAESHAICKDSADYYMSDIESGEELNLYSASAIIELILENPPAIIIE